MSLNFIMGVVSHLINMKTHMILYLLISAITYD